MHATTDDRWRPGPSREMLALRARLMACTRSFFAERQVMEVDTPACVNAGVTDINITCARAQVGDRDLFLHTSPEYAMKRLLAAGSGDIYQLCHVMRGDERSRLHNPEFALLEWYRTGFAMHDLIGEVAELLNTWMREAAREARPLITLRYRDTFQNALGIDPLDVELTALRTIAIHHGLDTHSSETSDRDGLLDFLMGVVIGPTLGVGSWLALTHYPASQAALAQLDPTDPNVALRFEIYADGIELANGFVELADAQEQADRFARDDAERARRGAEAITTDPLLLAALRHGMPACAGVAMGFDRCVMIASGATDIAQVMPFTIENA